MSDPDCMIHSCFPTVYYCRVTAATLPACWCAKSPQAPLGSGGRFITYANNMTLSWKGPHKLSDGGNKGQWGESEWRKKETTDGYVNVLGMVHSATNPLCLGLSFLKSDCSYIPCQQEHTLENVIFESECQKVSISSQKTAAAWSGFWHKPTSFVSSSVAIHHNRGSLTQWTTQIPSDVYNNTLYD